MYAYKDIGRLTRVVVVLLFVYMSVAVILRVVQFYAVILSRQEPAAFDMPIGYLAVAYFAVLLATIVMVCRWTYRANANAHALGGDLTVTPGWAVGWYFVPFANLYKPFSVMKEIWLASHHGRDWGAGDVPSLLPWWWGLWLGTNFLSNIVMRIEDDAPVAAGYLGLIDGILVVALSLTLIAILRRITRAQQDFLHRDVFA